MPGLRAVFTRLATAGLAVATLAGCGNIVVGPGFVLIRTPQYTDAPDGRCDPPNHDKPECRDRQRGAQPQQP